MATCENCGRPGESWYDCAAEGCSPEYLRQRGWGNLGRHEADLCLACVEDAGAGLVAAMVERAGRLARLCSCDIFAYSSHQKIGGAWVDVVRADDGAALSYGDLRSLDGRAAVAGDYLVPRLMMGSDYSGSTLERANQLAWLEEFGDVAGVHRVYGGHDTYGVAIRLDALTVEMCERLEALSDYPVLDDDALSRVESEAADEAWENWGEYDFRRELREYWGCDVEWPDARPGDEDGRRGWCRGPLRECFEEWRERANEYWESEGDGGPNVTCRLERVVSKGGIGLVVALARRGAEIEWDWPETVGGILCGQLWVAAVAGDDGAIDALADCMEESGISGGKKGVR